MKRVAIYARVTTTDQTCDSQLRDLREYCRARGWDQVTEFVDEGVSGTTDRRPALDELMAVVRKRRVDVVVVAAFDRFGRSVRHLVDTLELFRHLDVEFISLREQIDTGSPLGQAVFTIIAAIAQLERSLLVERVKAGLRRARDQGKHIGRPRLRINPIVLQGVLSRRLPSRVAARELGISQSAYLRLARAYTSVVRVTGGPFPRPGRQSTRAQFALQPRNEAPYGPSPGRRPGPPLRTAYSARTSSPLGISQSSLLRLARVYTATLNRQSRPANPHLRLGTILA